MVDLNINLIQLQDLFSIKSKWKQYMFLWYTIRRSSERIENNIIYQQTFEMILYPKYWYMYLAAKVKEVYCSLFKEFICILLSKHSAFNGKKQMPVSVSKWSNPVDKWILLNIWNPQIYRMMLVMKMVFFKFMISYFEWCSHPFTAKKH